MPVEFATDQDYLQLLNEALTQTFGVKVLTNDADSLRRRLYILRKQGGERYAPLTFKISPEDHNELWIMKKGGTNG